MVKLVFQLNFPLEKKIIMENFKHMEGYNVQ